MSRWQIIWKLLCNSKIYFWGEVGNEHHAVHHIAEISRQLKAIEIKGRPLLLILMEDKRGGLKCL